MARWEPVLDAVMRERGARLLAYARLLTGDDAEAQDVLQDALVRSFSRGRAFDDVNRAEAYVRRAIPTVFIDRLRKRDAAARAHRRTRDPEPHRPDTAAVLDVRDALTRLAPRERACMVLRFYDDLTVPAIAAHLGLAEGTVKRYLADASARMAVLLDTHADWDGDHTSVPVEAPAQKGAR
ncbi:sigma-70 family RNA polymerase sigma factor [Demequina sp. NBRC 110056]|uniref:sigma-70 family RNA polymerase sigma factor n=1 Tax=Demequina sp. NBRC 110056 TaxID=1570345 RepID=UPI0009FBEEEB|nr:sigma-70 family RNA polymerase sigma factor [Demequina sp. NBRC 110056]